MNPLELLQLLKPLRLKLPKNEINVLHIWDVAGVSCLLAKIMKPYGYNSLVIKRKSHDPFRFLEHYNQKYLLDIVGPVFLKMAERMAKKFDIVHIHSIFKLVPKIKKAKIVLHYHGTDLSRNLNNPFRIKCDTKADLILVSTPNLMQDGFKYLPNCIDTDMFKPMDVQKNNKALLFSIRYLDMNLIKEHLNNTDYDIYDREKHPLKYNEMPALLNKYKRYIDLKYVDQKKLLAYSKTGLESLACGLEVYNFNNKIVKGLPEIHTPKYVANKLNQYYKELLN